MIVAFGNAFYHPAGIVTNIELYNALKIINKIASLFAVTASFYGKSSPIFW
jgi:hypothetical protein